FIRKDLSPENELQYKELLGSMYETYLSNVSKSIDVPLEELSNVSNEMKVSLPAEAENYGLINKVGFEDELVSVMKSKIGQKETSKLRKISINKYIEAMKADETSAKDKIAVIVAEGDIVMGGDQGIVGETFANEIRKARNNKSIKAIVLRINSGGGSMTASDMIWRELMLTKGKKPIIASMSTAAASGGYYIAMPADSILAQPNTITGSIGIFGMWFNFGQFLENKIGITHDVVKTGKHSDIYTVTRPLTEVEKSIIQKGVNEGYEVFTRKAADARGMLQDDLKKIAEGRVWSGLQAKENGLIDGIGGLQDAIEMASDMAELPEYEVVYLPKEKLFIEDFIEKMSAKVQRSFVKETLDPYLKKVEGLKNFQGIQARMPQLEVR
ncbi:MAG: signal peptide peptidase SppA, partial [Bacteroidota bacterium]